MSISVRRFTVSTALMLALCMPHVVQAQSAVEKVVSRLPLLNVPLIDRVLNLLDPSGELRGQSSFPCPAPVRESESHAVASCWTEDATRDYYNAALHLPWRNETNGDWVDSAGVHLGTKAFAATAVTDTNSEKPVSWDVTDLVKEHGANFLIRRSGGTNFVFHSREAVDESKRPVLVITRGRIARTLAAEADTWLSGTTGQSLGSKATLASAGSILLRFNQGPDSRISKAVLTMVATASQYGNQTLAIYRPDLRPAYPAAPMVAYGGNSDVVLHIKDAAWRGTAMGAFRPDRMVINADGSLTVAMPIGTSTASDAGYAIPRGSRRETMFARTVMKVHDDWTATMGGKYPGLSNTGMADRRATKCGWGSRVADGVCWSARTNRVGSVPGTPYADTHQAISPYAYRYNRTSFWGEGPPAALPIEKGRFVVLDQMVKLNSIGADGTPNADGEVAYWLNGQIINRMTGIVWRNRLGDDTLPSEFWLDVYEGGTGYQAPHPHSVTFQEVIVSTKLLPFDKAALDQLNK